MQAAQDSATYRRFTGKLASFDLNKAIAGETVVTVSRYFVTNLYRKDGELHGQFDGGIWVTWSLTGTLKSWPTDLDLRMAAPSPVTFMMDRLLSRRAL